MGKCTVWVNGKKVAEHFGGYLPFAVDITADVAAGSDNVVAVRADNSDDPTYPPAWCKGTSTSPTWAASTATFTSSRPTAPT